MLFISLNIKYLVSYERVTQDEFGSIFSLGKGLIGYYIRGKTSPSIKLLMQICERYNLTLDDFVKKELEKHPELLNKENYVSEESAPYNLIDIKDQQILELKKEIKRLKERNKNDFLYLDLERRMKRMELLIYKKIEK